MYSCIKILCMYLAGKKKFKGALRDPDIEKHHIPLSCTNTYYINTETFLLPSLPRLNLHFTFIIAGIIKHINLNA